MKISQSILGIFIVFVTFVNLTQAQDNFITKHMKAYSDNDDFTSINMSMTGGLAESIMEELKSEMGDLGDQFMGMVKHMVQLNLLTTEKNAKKHYKDALALLKKENYKALMTIKEGKSTGVNVMAREGKNGIEEILMLVNDEEDFVLICFSGK